VAVCLGLAGIVAGLIVARRQRVSDEHLTSDALQREELREGWRALGVVAAHDAQQRDALVNRLAGPANSANSPPAQPNWVIVNVPTPVASTAPANLTNITLPNGSAPATGSAPVTGSAPTGSIGTPSDNWNFSSGYAPNGGVPYAPNQSVPPANYSPVQGYVPVPLGYPTPPNPTQNNYGTPQNSYGTPQNSYGTPAGGVPPSVGDGSIPGTAPNTASASSGLVGATPTTGSGTVPSTGAVTPSTPMATPAATPNTPSLPSGFSAP